MKRAVLLWLLLPFCAGTRCAASPPAGVTPLGERAYRYTAELTAFGPRPAGSAALEKARRWIEEKAQSAGARMERDTFLAATPLGPIEMANLSAVVPGRVRAERVLLVAHYETKRFEGFDFVGANDAASAVALLLALLPDLRKAALPFDAEIVLVDGEEALRVWSDTDSLYGSRRLASRLREGKPVRAAIVADMIGDADLKLVDEENCDPRLRRLLKETLAETGFANLLEPTPRGVADDHLPLIRAGIPTLHLMDFTYGGSGSPGFLWHTAADTIERISAASLSTVGEILLRLLPKI